MPQVNGAPKYCDAKTCNELKQKVRSLEDRLIFIEDIDNRIMSAERRVDYHLNQVMKLLSAPKGERYKGFSWMSYGGESKRRTLKNKRQ